ncbi:MAG: dihydroorotase [Acidithiobacillales bacterium SG8_45]|jgi:dihydroorotase|nr:MAG: dihydroorotase [Acidithiobacillales bacterium SG8_45]
MSLRITNGRIIDPANDLDQKADLFIDDEGFIVGIGKAPKNFAAELTIDASDLIVCPGLVDLQARVREPGLEYKATIESETLAAVSAGITTLVTPPDTTPVIDTPAMAQMIQQRAWRFGLAFIHPLGAMTRDLEGKQLSDMESLDEAGCVGVTNALNPIKDTLVLRRAMEYAASFDITVFLRAQDPWLNGGGCVHEGEVGTRLGLPGIPEAAETVAVARDLALIEQTGVRAHFCQLSTARAVAMIAEAQERGLPVTADVTAHHLHLSEHDIGYFNSQCHVIPPLRSERDRDGLRKALKDGVISVVCSDHQPHESDAKLAPFIESEPGVSGLETLLPLTLRLVDDGLIDLTQAIAALTSEPADIIGVDTGNLAIGSTADICIFDPEARWKLDTSNMISRGHNSPFGGWEFKGKVTHTLVGGVLVYEAED